jgi:hypothetical protein
VRVSLSRRLFNAADEECRLRWQFDSFDEDRFRGVLAELAAHKGVLRKRGYKLSASATEAR